MVWRGTRRGTAKPMSDKDSGTTPSEATRVHEQAEAAAPHQADRPPTQDEERAAPDGASPETAQDYQEMTETGARVKGEGEIP